MPDEKKSSLMVDVRQGDILKLSSAGEVSVELVHKSGAITKCADAEKNNRIPRLFLPVRGDASPVSMPKRRVEALLAPFALRCIGGFFL
jgi:uncharacterized Zn-finger protein